MFEFLNKERPDFVFDGTGSPAQVEAVRRIRTNITHVLPKKEAGGANVIVMVSTTASEGRAAVSRCLSGSFAQTGVKTLFIDCNLRDARGGNSGSGVREHLSGDAELNSVIKKGAEVDVILSGAPAKNANELISSHKFGEMLKNLSENYDYIFIDTPPLGNYPDGLAAAMLSDGVVVVTRQKRSSRVKLSDMLASLEFIGANILGFIMTDCKR